MNTRLGESEIGQLRRLERRLLLLLARKDLNAFIEAVLRDELGQPLRQTAIHRQMQDFLTEHRRALVVFPRYHGKTTQILGRVLFELGRNPSLRIKIVCANDFEASKRTRMLREIIERSESLHKIFPHLRPSKSEWQKHSFQLERDATLVDNSVESYGVLSSATGARADVLILDDVTDDRNSLFSAARRREVIQAVENKWFNLTHPQRSRIWWLGTPWHFDDAFERYRRGLAGDFAILDCHIPADLTPIWPERWPRSRLEEHRQLIGRIAFARGFHCMPISEDLQVFHEEWMKKSSCIPENLEYYVGVDPAFSAKSSADDTAVVVIGRSSSQIYILEAIARKGISLHELASLLKVIHARYKVTLFAFESVQAQAAIADEIIRTTGLPIQKVHTAQDKHVRMSRLAVHFENGRVFFASNVWPPAGTLGQLYTQLLQFPAGEHDDLCDALEFAVSASEACNFKIELW